MHVQRPGRGSRLDGRRPLCPQRWLPCVRGWGRGQCLQMLLKLVSLQGFGSFHHGDLETRARGGGRTQWGFQYPGLGRQGARLLQLSLQAGEGRGLGEAGPELPFWLNSFCAPGLSWGSETLPRRSVRSWRGAGGHGGHCGVLVPT